MRTFHPFPPPLAKPLPQNNVFGMASVATHQVEVAFEDAPEELRLRCANAASLLALKQAAFGRTRAGGTTPVDRDYHDAFLLIDAARENVRAELAIAGHEVRQRAHTAVDELASGDAGTAAAARELVNLGSADTQRQAETTVQRAAADMRRSLAAQTGE